jgi:sporulation protein YlmC with PRC-barrel domain
MMTTFRVLVIAASALGLAAAPARAQQQPAPQQGQQQTQPQTQQQVVLIAADTLKGAEIRDRQGQEIGSIDRLMVNPQTGRIEQVFVSPSAGLGIGRDRVDVSWREIDVKRDQQAVVLTMDRQALGADAAASPRTGDSREQPQQQTQQQTRLIDIDDIDGANLRDAQGQDLGSVNRVMIDPDKGEVASVIVATGGILGFGRDHVQIPWQNLQARWENDRLQLTAQRSTLEQAPAAERGWVRERTPAASPGQPARPGQQQRQ